LAELTRVTGPERTGGALDVLASGARDLPARQQALRGTIAWSYGLLAPSARELFRRLAVFAGGCTLEAIVAVAAGDRGQVLVDLTTLVDQSLLRPLEQPAGAAGRPPDAAATADRGDPPSETRYGMLELVREFALERLAEEVEAGEAHARHAAYYLALARCAEPELRGPRQLAWLACLDAEQHNLRAALVWGHAAVGGQPGLEPVLQLTVALWWFWYRRGYLREGRAWLERALALPAPTSPAGQPAPSVAAAGQLSLTAREYEVAERIARGLSNRQIAGALVISEGTAAKHVEHIMNKLGFRSRAQIAAWVVERRGPAASA
jgi:predicted ATPase/DNA-binding CsgD family transcriptional regulator